MSQATAKYAMVRELPKVPFERAVERLTETLKAEGFEVLSQLPVHDLLRQKLEVNFRKYLILGACNAKLAHQGLELETHLGLLLPCNLVVSERPNGGSTVSALDPYAIVKVTENFQLEDVATEARERIARAIAAI